MFCRTIFYFVKFAKSGEKTSAMREKSKSEKSNDEDIQWWLALVLLVFSIQKAKQRLMEKGLADERSVS